MFRTLAFWGPEDPKASCCRHSSCFSLSHRIVRREVGRPQDSLRKQFSEGTNILKPEYYVEVKLHFVRYLRKTSRILDHNLILRPIASSNLQSQHFQQPSFSYSN